jgi:hypothetical protein
MTLLSSQRELLTQLKRENAMRGSTGLRNTSSGSRYICAEDSSLSNKAVSERRSSMDMLLSKRFSLGMGNDNYVLPAFSWDIPCDGGYKDVVSVAKKRNCKGYDKHNEGVRRKKRRLSSLGFLSSTFFEDNLANSSRRNSLVTILKPAMRELETGATDISFDVEDNENDENVSFEPLELEQPKVDPVKCKVALETFRAAMEQSQKSQLSIHDWDRKMGLKRSHSKTMRLSSRSRKKLKGVFKNEINALASKI